MAAKHMLVIILALIASSVMARAEFKESPQGLPTFTQVEDGIIERNETLALVARSDPWLVRQLLDALAALDARSEVLERTSAPFSEAAPHPVPDPGPDDAFDPNDDPDLRRLERASPEALHDLFQLLKRAGGGHQPLAK